MLFKPNYPETETQAPKNPEQITMTFAHPEMDLLMRNPQKSNRKSDFSLKKKFEESIQKSTTSNDFNTPLARPDTFKILENIPKIHAFEVPRRPEESPAKVYAKNKRNPYFVFSLKN